MKIRATIIAMLTIGSSMSAQTIIGTHPANPSTGKILTMEETIMSREFSPANLQCRWIDNENIFMRKDGEEIAFNIATRLEEKYKAEPVQEKVVMEGRSLYYNAGNDIRLTIAESESPEMGEVSQGGCLISQDKLFPSMLGWISPAFLHQKAQSCCVRRVSFTARKLVIILATGNYLATL